MKQCKKKNSVGNNPLPVLELIFSLKEIIKKYKSVNEVRAIKNITNVDCFFNILYIQN
jgi:hypothetical protein